MHNVTSKTERAALLVTLNRLQFEPVLASASHAKEKKAVEGKKHEKRRLIDLGYGSGGGFDSFGHGGFELGGFGDGLEDHGVVKSNTIHKTIKVPVPHPVPVPIEKKVPLPVPYKVAVPVDRLYPVHVIKSYLVLVEKPVPYTIIKKIPYPIKVLIKVPVAHPVAVPVLKSVPYPVPYPVNVPIVIKKKVPVLIKDSHDSEFGSLDGLGGGLGRFNGDFEGGLGSEHDFGDNSFNFHH